jgi:hypothetical protein
MPDPVTTQRRIQIEHVRIEAAKPFEAVKAALEDLVPPLDPVIPEALREGDIRRAKEALQRGPELAIFSARDHGGLLRIADLARKAVQYEIGNPLTATRMTQHRLPASPLCAAARLACTRTRLGMRSLNTTGPPRYSANSGTSESRQWQRELDASLERVLAQAFHSGEER